MITPRGTIRLLGVSSFLLIGCIFPAITVLGAENKLRHADSRISIDHARIRGKRVDADARASGAAPAPAAPRRHSMVARAATGQSMDEVPQRGLDGSLVQADVRQVGFLEEYGRGHHGHGCGPVCDCGGCDPVCGIEYVDDPACGFEVGCGVGAALEMLGPRTCGVEGCTDCCETACGVEQIYVEGPACGTEFAGDCSCDACVSECEVDRFPLCLPLFRVNWNRFQFSIGTQGFKGPMSSVPISSTNSSARSDSGSFGFYQAINEGRSLKKLFHCDLAAQLGVRTTQNNLSGSEFTRDRRYQVFVTGGIFRQVDFGLQYGLVVDYLNDDWYFQSDLVQLRGELSWKTRGCHVYGFNFMAGVRRDTSDTLVLDVDDNVISSSVVMEATDQYRFFYRRLLPSSGTWDAFAGWTDNSDGLLGMHLSLPMRRNLVLATGSTYLIPNEGRDSGGHREEGWNISLGLVYRPGGPLGCGRYCRPMFEVADNGTFMVDRLP